MLFKKRHFDTFITNIYGILKLEIIKSAVTYYISALWSDWRLRFMDRHQA